MFRIVDYCAILFQGDLIKNWYPDNLLINEVLYLIRYVRLNVRENERNDDVKNETSSIYLM